LIGKIAINGIIDDILRLGSSDFKSLVETRILIEAGKQFVLATRRTVEDIAQIKSIDAYAEKVHKVKTLFRRI
jgi:GntR family transcriptional repressor for pyruvate dehydrogenase complex